MNWERYAVRASARSPPEHSSAVLVFLSILHWIGHFWKSLIGLLTGFCWCLLVETIYHTRLQLGNEYNLRVTLPASPYLFFLAFHSPVIFWRWNGRFQSWFFLNLVRILLTVNIMSVCNCFVFSKASKLRVESLGCDFILLWNCGCEIFSWQLWWISLTELTLICEAVFNNVSLLLCAWFVWKMYVCICTN